MNNTMNSEVRLTQYSAGGGCGCKISPSDLEKIIHQFGGTPSRIQSYWLAMKIWMMLLYMIWVMARH